MNVAPLASSFASISHRALSTASELDELSKAANEDSRFADLGTTLHHINNDAGQLKQALDDGPTTTRIQATIAARPVIRASVQTLLPKHLTRCESALGIVDKQIRRLVSMSQDVEVDSHTLADYSRYLELQARAFQTLRSLVTSKTTAEQERIFHNSEVVVLMSELEQALEKVLQQKDLVRPRDGGDLPEYTEAPARSPVPTSPSATAGPSKEGSGFFSSLRLSFDAMTAAMRPKPEPFVVPLCQAAIRGDLNQMRGLLSQGANIDGRNENGQTALICAIEALNDEAVEFLLNSGAGIAVRDRKGKPPLFRATKAGDVHIATTILNRGANPNERSSTGRPFFVDACAKSHLEMVRLLLQRGADPNTFDLSGRSVFIHAVQAYNMPLVTLLLDHGANIQQRDITGRSGMMLALIADQPDLVRLLLSRGANASERDINGTWAINYAIDRKDYDMVRLLLDKGHDPNPKDLYGKSLLNTLITSGNTDIVKIMLERGADANAGASGNNETMLLHAMDLGHWEIALLLVKYGANPNQADGKGRTPLIEALTVEYKELVQLLLQRGANPNLGGTVMPLGLFMGRHDNEWTQMLKTYGAVDLSAHLPPRPAPPSAQSQAQSTRQARPQAAGPSRPNGAPVTSPTEPHEPPPDYNSIDKAST